MPSNWANMSPGISVPRTEYSRSIFLQQSEKFLAGGKKIKGSLSGDPGNTGNTRVLRPGLVMGRITATGLYAPSVITTLTLAYTSGGTTLTVGVAGAIEFLRRMGASGTATANVIGAPTATGTVAKTALTWSAVDTTLGTITATSLGVDKTAGAFITAADGSEVPRSFIPDWEQGGIWVQDQDGNDVDVDFPLLPVWGTIITANLIPYPGTTNTTLLTYLMDLLSTAEGGKFSYDSYY